MGYEFRFDEEKCTGCFACHIACLDAHYGPEAEAKSFRTVKKFIRQEERFQKNVCPGCMHCGACMDACPTHAIYREAESGLVFVKQEQCVGCKTCETICPMHVIHQNREGKMVKCDGCRERLAEGREPACVRNCPVHAITVAYRATR